MPRFGRDALCRQVRWTEIDTDELGWLLQWAHDEDLGGRGRRRKPTVPGDATTSLLPANACGQARLVARSDQVVCGLPLLEPILRVYGGGVDVTTTASDGDRIPAGTVLAALTGPVTTLLMAERVLLNFLQKLTGIATHTARAVTALGPGETRLLDTRKTTPGWRMLEKYAVACGGAWNHRLGLDDRIMFKDNHLAVAGSTGSLADLVRRAREERPDLPVQVEVDALAQIAPLLEAGPDVLLLDNFADEELREAVALIGDRACTEASGGIDRARLPRLAGMGLTFISLGALTHQATWVDIGLDWDA